MIQKEKKLVKRKVVGRVNERSYLVKDIYGSKHRRNRKYLRPTKLEFTLETKILYELEDFSKPLFSLPTTSSLSPQNIQSEILTLPNNRELLETRQ